MYTCTVHVLYVYVLRTVPLRCKLTAACVCISSRTCVRVCARARARMRARSSMNTRARVRVNPPNLQDKLVGGVLNI